MNTLKVKDYTMIIYLEGERFSEVNKFCDLIRGKIKEGYVLFGKTTVEANSGMAFFTQAMVLLEDEKTSGGWKPGLAKSPHDLVIHIRYNPSLTLCGAEIKLAWEILYNGEEVTCERCLRAIPSPA